MGMYRKAALNDLRQKIGTKGVKELRKKLMEEEGAFVNYFNTLKIGERDVKAAKSRGVTILKAFTKKCDKAKQDAINALSTKVTKETTELRKRRKSDSMLADFDRRIALTQRALTELNSSLRLVATFLSILCDEDLLTMYLFSKEADYD